MSSHSFCFNCLILIDLEILQFYHILWAWSSELVGVKRGKGKNGNTTTVLSTDAKSQESSGFDKLPDSKRFP